MVNDIKNIHNPEWRIGVKTEDELHDMIYDYVKSTTTFEELYFYFNDIIESKGFRNLDFMGNLGHSIENDKSKRIYIEKGNVKRLSDVSAFTFEPHISYKGSPYGFKKENIYSYKNGVLLEL